MNLYDVLRKPLITEKNTVLQAENKYAFKVADVANKRMVKEAVEKTFNVTVTAVNIIIVKGKSKRMGRRIIESSPWKKAIVTLKAGEKIELFEGV